MPSTNRLIWTLLLLPCVASRRGVHPDLMGGDPSYPGMKIRLTQRGMNYVGTLAANVIDTVVPAMKIPTINRVLPNNQGNVKIENLVVYMYKRPDVVAMRLVTPDTIRWTMRGMSIGVKGRISGKFVVVLPIDFNGDLTFKTEGIDFQMEILVDKSRDGHPTVRSKSCHATIRSVDIAIDNGGIFGLLLGVFKGMAIDQIKPEMTRELCEQTKEIVDEQFKNILSGMPVRFPIVSSETFQVFKATALGQGNSSKGGGGLGAGMNSVNLFDLSKPMDGKAEKDDPATRTGLWLDYSLKRRPDVLRDYVEMVCRGEVSWGARGHTPFHPVKMDESSFRPNRMLYILASDYMLNSLMYHAYRNGLLRYELTPESPGLGPFLKTSCFGTEVTLCLGDIIEGLDEAHPDRDLEMMFYPTRSPAFFFKEDDKSDIDVKGVLFIFVRGLRSGEKKQVMAAQVELKAEANIRMEKNVLLGDVRMKEFDMTLRRSNIPQITRESIKELAPMAGDIIEGLTNDMLSAGLPMPGMSGSKLINPDIRIMDRVVRLETDLSIDSQAIADFATESIANMDG